MAYKAQTLAATNSIYIYVSIAKKKIILVCVVLLAFLDSEILESRVNCVFLFSFG